MAFVDRILHPFTRNRANGQKLDTEKFIAERERNMSHLSKEDIDRMSDEALAQVDTKQALREVKALRERMKVQPNPSARNMPD